MAKFIQASGAGTPGRSPSDGGESPIFNDFLVIC